MCLETNSNTRSLAPGPELDRYKCLFYNLDTNYHVPNMNVDGPGERGGALHFREGRA